MTNKTVAQPKSKSERPDSNKFDALSHRLYVWQKDRGLSYEALGEMIGASRRTIYRWYTEHREPDMKTAQRIYHVTDGYVGLLDWPTEYTKEKKRNDANARRKKLLKDKASEPAK